MQADDRARLRELFELMLLIRAFEPEAERQYKAAKIGGYCHLATGQEADLLYMVMPFIPVRTIRS